MQVAADGTMHVLPDPLAYLLAIHGRGLASGFFWTPLTYIFLHGSLTHLLLNCLGLWVMGNAVEESLGTGRFRQIFLVSGILGGVGWALAQGLSSGVPCVGASAGVLGLTGAFAVVRPNERFMMLLPFPVSVSARTLAIWLAAANALDLAFGHGHIAYLAHLFGLLAGALYALYLLRNGGWPSFPRSLLRNRQATRRSQSLTLDDVLEKINRKGMGSLDAEDRRILNEAARRGLEGYPHRD